MVWIATLSVFLVVSGMFSLISFWVFGLSQAFGVACALSLVWGAFMGSLVYKLAKEFDGP